MGCLKLFLRKVFWKIKYKRQSTYFLLLFLATPSYSLVLHTGITPDGAQGIICSSEPRQIGYLQGKFLTSSTISLAVIMVSK